MSEIEQLRKELNELRERVAVLEKRPIAPYTFGPTVGAPARDPLWINPRQFAAPCDQYAPPFTVTCEAKP